MAIYCIGDLHGKFDQLAEKVRQIQPHSHILCVGDIGLGFEDSNHPSCLFYLNDVATEMNTHIWMIRGNHDNPFIFRGLQKTWNDSFSHIKLMGDVDSLELEGQHVIFVGGAISVDRSHEGRVDGYSWWKEEPVHESCPSRVYRIVEEFGPADLLVTHAGPITALPVLDEFDPNIYYYSQDDPHLLHDINVERTRLSDCVQYSRAPTVVYGHYHAAMQYCNTGVSYRCLAELELWEFKANKTAHLPVVGITEEEKAKVETAPITLKAPLKAIPQPDVEVAKADTHDATTEDLVAKTENLRKTTAYTVTSSKQAKQLPPLPANPTMELESDIDENPTEGPKKKLPPM